GSALALLSSELSFPLPTGTDNFRFAIFLDSGTLAASKDSLYSSEIRVSAGFGLRIQPQPFFSINLDFAWPLRKMDSDEERRFHFFFDTSF
ncbi:MAG: BamA/TamA family outer membrane protein, partial [Planctomycetota bacterium]|nr:BamA/TamA family outer membrane protein [Planctomycetota bacterium]